MQETLHREYIQPPVSISYMPRQLFLSDSACKYFFPLHWSQQLIKTILTVKKRLNRKLAIEGILLTMVDFRTNYARDIASRVHTTYGSQIEVFENVIPMSVKAAETSAEGKSIYMHCPKGKVAEAYMKLTQEVLSNEK